MATFIVVLAVALFSTTLPLLTLAKAASVAILIVFAIVNLALVVIKRREGAPTTSFSVPLLVPVLGFVASAAIVVFETIRWVTGLG